METEDFSLSSSDEELQEEFSKGRLKPGRIVRREPKKEFVNDTIGLEKELFKLKRKGLRWLERMDVTAAEVDTPLGDQSSSAQSGHGVDAEDDFKREMHFFQQAQSSVLVGLGKLEELGVPHLRPDDYFAEMIKTDDHMKKVRQSLLSRQKILEHKEKARKVREMKKFGKKGKKENDGKTHRSSKRGKSKRNKKK